MITSLMSQEEMVDMYGQSMLRQGREEGREEGFEQGIEQGIEQGREEGELNMIARLRDNPELLKQYGIIS